MTTREVCLSNAGAAITAALAALQRAQMPSEALAKLLEVKRDVNAELAKAIDPLAQIQESYR